MESPDRPELPPYVCRIQGSACPGAEDKIVIAPLRSGGEPFCGLPLLVGPERVDRHRGQA